MRSKDREPEEILVEPILLEAFPPEYAGMSMNRLAHELDDEDTLLELATGE